MISLLKVRRKILKFKILIKAFSIYFNSFFNVISNQSNSNVIFLNVSNAEIYNRYIYILIKYFLISNYQVFLRRSLKSIYYMLADVDTSYVFKESCFFLGNPSSESRLLVINDSILSSNYFDFLLSKQEDLNDYFVPIGFHPFVYFKDYWPEHVKNNVRFKSLFMAGNFSYVYSNDYNEKFFDVINRNKIKEEIERLGLVEKVNADGIDEFLEKVKNNSVYIVDRKNDVQIHPKDIFFLLSRFEFFFALPGLYMPLCHNIIEAMSVGTIPFLQDGYARAFTPSLKNGINCITYSNLKDLKERVNYIFSLDEETIRFLRKGVNSYYKENCLPESIVSKILSKNYSRIYLMAEKLSVDQFAYRVMEDSIN